MGVKLLLLAATAALSLYARLRLIPDLTDDNLTGLAWHIRAHGHTKGLRATSWSR